MLESMESRNPRLYMPLDYRQNDYFGLSHTRSSDAVFEQSINSCWLVVAWFPTPEWRIEISVPFWVISGPFVKVSEFPRQPAAALGISDTILSGSRSRGFPLPTIPSLSPAMYPSVETNASPDETEIPAAGDVPEMSGLERFQSFKIDRE